MTIKIVPLGAGQDVGRSCILVTIGGKNIMFDCGMHMGFNDARRFPDFTYISKTGNFTEMIDAVIISHFHLDHCGALPFFTEMCGYDGPIYMTHPTKAICPILLEDYRKITVTKVGQENFFTEEMIKNCMKKVIPINLHQTIKVDEELEIKAYYAGHVLGAAMIHLKVGNESCVYTGDYNTTADRHLGAAWIDKCRPDVLITESTYATTIRDSKRARERDFLKNVHECVANGGRVLIPCFALGRAQELCVLLESYWEQTGLKYPIYFSTGLTAKATNYYKMFIGWTNQKIKNSFVQRNVFDYKHIQPFDPNYLDIPGPMVLFSTPGMLHQGRSLEMFMKWAPNPKNMVIIPGYCVPGTVGAKILAGEKVIKTENFPATEVNLKVRNLSFSAHADAKGIMQLIRQCSPRHVVLVHGEKLKMESLQVKIQNEYGIPTYLPANGNTVYIDTSKSIPIQVSPDLVERYASMARDQITRTPLAEILDPKERAMVISKIKPILRIPIEGILMVDETEQDSSSLTLSKSTTPSLISVEEIMADTRLPHHQLQFHTRIPFPSTILHRGPEIKPPLPLARLQDPFAVALGVARNALQMGLTNAEIAVSIDLELSANASRTLSHKITIADAIEIAPIGTGAGLHGGDSNEEDEQEDEWEEENWEKGFWAEEAEQGETVEPVTPHALSMKWSYADQDLAEKVLELLSSAFNQPTPNEI